MRIVAIIAAYNEERFLGTCLDHLFRHGVETYLIDNSSTDNTVEIARSFQDRGVIGIETFPRATNTYNWQAILQRKEYLASTLQSDWFIHLDPDEIRLPPNGNQTLAEALTTADAGGFNAVDFFEFTFIPTREAPDHDHKDFLRSMRHYYPFLPWTPHRLTAWKRQPVRIELAWYGGHRVRFPGLRVAPEMFKMKHYPFLSASHLIQKYTQRSFDPSEVKRGWHGWRSRLSPERVKLPSQNELRTYVSDDELDSSNPRSEEYAQGWTKRRVFGGW